MLLQRLIIEKNYEIMPASSKMVRVFYCAKKLKYMSLMGGRSPPSNLFCEKTDWRKM